MNLVHMTGMIKMIKRTGVMCMITVPDMNREDGIRYVDLGNFYELADGSKCVLLSLADAKKYHKLIDFPIYIRK